MKTALVAFHSHCYDGHGAAFAAWKNLGDTAEYLPVTHSEPPPDISGYQTLYILDFCYPRETLLQLAEQIKIVLIDHHKTAQADLEGLEHPNLVIHFDMNRSGAGMTWDYFHRDYGPAPADSTPIPRPPLINHIEDRDLWRFALEGSREVHSALVSLPMDFKVWDTLDIEKLKVEGAGMLRQYNQLVQNICDKSWVDSFLISPMRKEYGIPRVNTSIAWSEVGEALLSKYPEALFVASFTELKDHTMWSLRSKGEYDVSEVAKAWGGGGHRNAAGFKLFKKLI